MDSSNKPVLHIIHYWVIVKVATARFESEPVDFGSQALTLSSRAYFSVASCTDRTMIILVFSQFGIWPLQPANLVGLRGARKIVICRTGSVCASAWEMGPDRNDRNSYPADCSTATAVLNINYRDVFADHALIPHL